MAKEPGTEDMDKSQPAEKGGEKIAKLGIKRESDLMYYVKDGDVFAIRRAQPGEQRDPNGKPQAIKIASAGIPMDYSRYLYYLDGDGDIARRARQVTGTVRAQLDAVVVKGGSADEGLDGEDPVPFAEVPCSLTRDVHPKERCLRVDDYARALSAVLNASFGEFCFAVYGHWGRGKTFLMQRLAAILPASYRTIWFSAWKYRTTPETWVYLYETFVRAARKDGVFSTTPRAVRAHLSKHGVWPLMVLLLTLAVALLGLGLLPVLIGLLGVIGVAKAYTVSRWAKKLPPRLLSLPQHADKLGLQATVGDDLTALIKGWIPITKKAIADAGQTTLPGKRWLVLYFASIAAIAASLYGALQGHAYGFVQLDPSNEVRLAAVMITVAVGIVLPVWVIYGGRGTERIALIVDDLDRCDPATMLDIIESLKLLLEDPEVSARVQVVMLIEEECLHHAIEKRYPHIKDLRPRADQPQADDARIKWTSRAVSETVEKLFLAHLRLPELDRDDLAEVMRTYLEQHALRDGAAAQPQQAAVDVVVPLDLNHAAKVKPVDTSRLGGLVFTAEERAALLSAVDGLIAEARGRFLGPRSIRTFLTRYQLAKFLLATRKAGCSPRDLVRRLVNPDPAVFTYPDLDAVIAEVS